MTNTDCTNPDHDHECAANDDPGLCNDCKAPIHFDESTGWYHHDDPDIECFLSTGRQTPCTPITVMVE